MITSVSLILEMEDVTVQSELNNNHINPISRATRNTKKNYQPLAIHQTITMIIQHQICTVYTIVNLPNPNIALIDENKCSIN